MEPRRLRLIVPPQREGQTVDLLLRQVLGLSGTAVKRAKALPSGILLDGIPVYVSQRVRAGQILTVAVGEAAAGGPRPVEGPLDLVYEDEDLVVVNKAPGIPAHPGPGHYDDTLGNYLAYYYKQAGILAGYHPVHRLDRGTSGLMVVAKYPHVQEVLKSQLHTSAFCRTYLAICEGIPHPPRGVMDAPIGRAEGSILARRVDPAGQPARTHYRVLEADGGRALVELVLDTGRTHQIRVHMAHMGCPLTGDFLYGTEDRDLISRPALHAWRVSLCHPITGQALSWTAPLPADMTRLVPSFTGR